MPGLALALLPACILGDQGGTGGQARLVATWDVRDVDGTILPCPDGATATVVARPITADGQLAGNAILDSYDCAAGQGALDVPPDLYDASVEIVGYAPSTSGLLDLTVADGSAHLDVVDDGGYVALAWTLVGATSKQVLSCGAAGATDIDLGLAVPTLPCAAGAGTTAAVVAGSYVVTVTARSPGGTAGASTPIATAVAPRNEVTDLGTVAISIPGM